MAQDDTTGGVAPTETAMDITPKPGVPVGGATGGATPPVPPATPAADTAAPKEPTRTAMDITPDDAG